MQQIKLFPGYLGKMLLHILISILTGALILSALCMLPSGPMDRNLEKSAAVFADEGIYPVLSDRCTSQLDSTTDALILLISACDSDENPIVQAMSGTRNTLSSVEAASEELAAHYGEGIPFDGSEPYYQYWHGYQLIIRPLLSLMSYPAIRVLNGIVQTCLLIFLCLLMHKNGLGRYVLPYIVSVLMLMPLALAMSLQFSSCYYILTLGSIFLLLIKNSLDRLDGLLFLYIGIATAFFDFLTYPVATLGIPAVFYVCLLQNMDIRNTFCRGVKVCFSWAIGYIGMWAGKWLIGSWILGENVLALAAGKLAERSSGEAEISMLQNIRAALSANIRSFLHTPVTILMIVLALYLLVRLVFSLRAGKTGIAQTGMVFFPFVILAIIPIAWYIVTAQHAVIHHWFTHKGLVVSVFSGLSAFVKATEKSI